MLGSLSSPCRCVSRRKLIQFLYPRKLATSPRQDELSYKLRQKHTVFNDFAYIETLAGKGGDGCVSFLREKFLPKGPPNGGSGGSGGDVYIMAVEGETSLAETRRAKAKGGANGRGSSLNGKKGEDLLLKVPVGTVVRELELPMHLQTLNDAKDRGPWVHYPGDAEVNSESDRLQEAEKTLRKHARSLNHAASRRMAAEKILLDLSSPTPASKPHLLCRGGVGGFGNTFFQTAENRAPRFASRGQSGEHKYFALELKTLADVGLVGLPNAGKSTFLGAISNARPRVADWAFTTLSPYLGTITYMDERFTVADIPGIIRGASQNKGLGHGFLRHIERADILAMVIDLSNAPVEDYATLRAELKAHSAGLETRQSIIIANKADLPETEQALHDLRQAVDGVWSQIDAQIRSCQTKPLVVPLSSKDQMGVKQAVEIMKVLVRRQKARRREAEAMAAEQEELPKIIDA